MSYTRVGRTVANYGDDLFKRATQQRTLREGVREAFGKSRFQVTEEIINGKKEIVTYCKNADGTIDRWFANSAEVYGQNNAIQTGRYMRPDGKGSAFFEYKPNECIDCNYTLTHEGDTFKGILMSQGAGGRNIEELNLAGNRITTNDGSLGHWFGMFIQSIFG